MKKSIASNKRIRYTLLSILFSMLFILTALSYPIEAHADGDTRGINQTPNIDGRDANVDDASADVQAGYLYYAASGHRCGVMWYVVTDTGSIVAHGLLMDESGQADYLDYVADATTFDSAYLRTRHGYVSGSITGSVLNKLDYEPNVSTVYYDNGWKAKGITVLNYLMEDVQDEYNMELVIDHIKQPTFPRWAYHVVQQGGGSALSTLARPDCKWNVIIEPVSVNYLYTEATFDEETQNAVHGDTPFEAGSPVPTGTWMPDGSYKPDVYIGTATELLYLSNRLERGGTAYTWKFYNTQLPYSLCLDNDINVHVYIGGSAGARYPVTAPPDGFEAERLYESLGHTDGRALASIDVNGLSLPPIHTFGGTTPGNTEEPSEENGTTGECIIRKLYYTETLNADGTVNTEADPQYRYFERTGTTPFISVDEEDGYEIEQYRRSKVSTAISTKEDFYALDYILIGRSARIERLMTTDSGDDKYIYILYKKVETLPAPAEFEFELQESQISKRVTFLESTKTAALVTNSFSWTSPAHTTTACQSHGGYGHHLDCDTVWDTAPVTGVAHTHTDSCSQACSTDHEHTDSCPQACAIVWDTEPVTGVAHTHVNACYDTPCSSFGFTDNSIKLGITLDPTSVNKAVVSTHNATVYNDPTVNTIHANIGHGVFTRTNSGADTISKNNFNFVTVLFRGNDKLTLAHWKNAATGKYMGYLTGISLDPAYNFKSANTPQGTRKAGEVYLETTSTKFINSSPDTQTTYGGTVGAHGRCSDSKSYTFTKADGTSSDYTIQDIKVNIKVFWANGIGPASSASLPSTQVAGSASFYPYIRMRYDNNTQNDVPIYVLGQRQCSATFYDYASVSISGGDSVITVNSNQWSTHAKAQQNILAAFSGRALTDAEKERVKATVLPGGATLSIAARSNNVRTISVVTMQAYLAGNGKTQVDSTGGTNSLPTDRSQLQSIHNGLASSVASTARTVYIAQYIQTGVKLNASEMSSAQQVRPGDAFAGNGTTFSTDSKYHFSNYNDTKLNVNVGDPSFNTYTFYTDTMGNIRCAKNNTSPTESAGTIIASKGSDSITGGDSVMQSIATRTGVVTALRKACVDNEGDDTEAAWAPDGKWYNEAFDGVTYLHGVTTISIGIWDPLERTTVLDPKETPSQSSKGDFFTSFNSSYFKSTTPSGDILNVGTFVNSNGSSRQLSLNFANLYQSEVFYIPNVTTQDLK